MTDRQRLAKLRQAVSGGILTLGVIEPDGTNDTTLVADCGAFSTTTVLYPMWRHDDSKIVFYNGAPTPDEWQSIEPDGSNQATEFTSFPASQFWTPHAMHTDRFFFTNPLFAPTNEWRLYEAVFGGSVAAVSPTRFLSRAVQRGFPMVHEGRVYCIQEGDNSANGLESVFSILPDGSDYIDHFDPDESGAPWFETPTFA